MNVYLVRLETPGDLEGIDALLLEAFPTSLERDLVNQLRDDDDIVFSLVALEQEHVIGHAVFSRMQAPAATLGLAPVAVASHRRCRGIAAAIIKFGLEQARSTSWSAVVVLGDPAYYSRFGFSLESVQVMQCQFAGPGLMGLALEPHGLHGSVIAYAAAFSSISEEG